MPPMQPLSTSALHTVSTQENLSPQRRPCVHKLIIPSDALVAEYVHHHVASHIDSAQVLLDQVIQSARDQGLPMSSKLCPEALRISQDFFYTHADFIRARELLGRPGLSSGETYLEALRVACPVPWWNEKHSVELGVEVGNDNTRNVRLGVSHSHYTMLEKSGKRINFKSVSLGVLLRAAPDTEYPRGAFVIPLEESSGGVCAAYIIPLRPLVWSHPESSPGSTPNRELIYDKFGKTVTSSITDISVVARVEDPGIKQGIVYLFSATSSMTAKEMREDWAGSENKYTKFVSPNLQADDLKLNVTSFIAARLDHPQGGAAPGDEPLLPLGALALASAVCDSDEAAVELVRTYLPPLHLS